MVHQSGYHATVLGWTSWYGSYGLGDHGTAWCIDHGIRAPDADLHYVPVAPPMDDRTQAAMSWAVATGLLADRVGAAAVMLVLHDFMGAVYPFGRIDVDRLAPQQLSGFGGAEAAVIERARLIKRFGLARADLRDPYRVEVAATPVPPGSSGLALVRVTDRDGRAVPGAPVRVVATASLEAEHRTTDAFGNAAVGFVAHAGRNDFLAATHLPSSRLRVLAPTLAAAQRITQPSWVEAVGATAFELPPETTTTTSTTPPETTTTRRPPPTSSTTTTTPPETTTTTRRPPPTTSTTTNPPETIPPETIPPETIPPETTTSSPPETIPPETTTTSSPPGFVPPERPVPPPAAPPSMLPPVPNVPQLPRTGVDRSALAALGTGLVLLGGSLRALAGGSRPRRLRRAASEPGKLPRCR